VSCLGQITSYENLSTLTLARRPNTTSVQSVRAPWTLKSTLQSAQTVTVFFFRKTVTKMTIIFSSLICQRQFVLFPQYVFYWLKIDNIVHRPQVIRFLLEVPDTGKEILQVCANRRNTEVSQVYTDVIDGVLYKAQSKFSLLRCTKPQPFTLVLS